MSKLEPVKLSVKSVGLNQLCIYHQRWQTTISCARPKHLHPLTASVHEQKLIILLFIYIYFHIHLPVPNSYLFLFRYVSGLTFMVYFMRCAPVIVTYYLTYLFTRFIPVYLFTFTTCCCILVSYFADVYA